MKLLGKAVFGLVVGLLWAQAHAQLLKPSYSWSAPYYATAWYTQPLPVLTSRPDLPPYILAADVSFVYYLNAFQALQCDHGDADVIDNGHLSDHAVDPDQTGGVVYRFQQIDACATQPKQWDVRATYVSQVDSINTGGDDSDRDEDSTADPQYTDTDCGCDGSNMVGDPINAATGNAFLKQQDGVWGRWLHISRFYNSQGMAGSGYAGNPFGSNWTYSYSDRLITSLNNVNETGVHVVGFLRSDGKIYTFKDLRDGRSWQAQGHNFVLSDTHDADGYVTGWKLKRSDNGTVEAFDPSGLLLSITDSEGFVVKLTYSTGTTNPAVAPQAGMLIKVTDPLGRALQFVYNQRSQIISVKPPGGGNITYGYDDHGLLESVRYGDNGLRQYLWNEVQYSLNAHLPAALTGIIDENGKRLTSLTYDANGAATKSERPDGSISQVTYHDDGSADVLMPEGTTSTYHFTLINQEAKFLNKSSACLHCGTAYKAVSYDANGNPLTRADFNGGLAESGFDASNRETSRKEYDKGAIVRRSETDWNGTLFRRPSEMRFFDGNGALITRIDWIYNSRGQVTVHCVIDATNSTSKNYTCSGSDTPPDGVKREVYSYCAKSDSQCPMAGLLLSVMGSRTDISQVSHYTYYTAASNGARPGDLYAVTNEAGHTTTFLQYDGAGRVLRLKTPNSVIVDMTYDSRGRLSTRVIRNAPDGAPSTQDAQTTWKYDAVGNLVRRTDPDGVMMNYGYDALRQLNSITSPSGSNVQYVYDVTGQPYRVQAFTAAGQPFSYSHSVSHGSNGLVDSEFNASNVKTHSISYNAAGKPTEVTDIFGMAQRAVYDDLGRLTQWTGNATSTDASLKPVVQYAYDSQDNLLGLTDPDGLTTTYQYDGLGNLVASTSPDTGTTLSVRDAAGLLIGQTDARGVSQVRTYDALNRLTEVSYSDSNLNVVYHYDETDDITGCVDSYPLGHLTRVVELAVTTTLCYDLRGNIVQKRQALGSQTDSTVYSYSLANRLLGVKTPSGTSVQYSLNPDGRVASVVANSANGTINVASNISYLPFGPIAGYTLGNGQVVNRSYDANYRLIDLVSPVLGLHFVRDDLGHITALGKAPGANPALETYRYDALYRLSELRDASDSTVEAYTYSKTGDRATKVGAGLGSGIYSYQSGSHHLASVGNAERTYDAIGNTTGSAIAGEAFGYGYDARNRMSVVQRSGSTVGAYTYNAFGQRVAKSASFPQAVSERFTYDQDGRLIGEYGTSSRDYIWLEDLPVAVLDVQGGSVVPSFVHSDDANTPRAVADASGKLIWELPRQADPFGEKQPTSTTGFGYNLRFPGQYYDVESGLVQNVNRDYEPATGRYLQSDPIGLRASLSTYAYANNNPLHFTDPLGLQQRSSDLQLALVPGQGAWDASVNSWQRGQYGMSTLYAATMLGEQILFVGSLGTSSFARSGAVCTSKFTANELTAHEIRQINLSLGGRTELTGSAETVIANMAYREGVQAKAATAIRDIAGRHLFDDANKRTAQAAAEKILGSGADPVKIRAVIDKAATGELRSVEEISKALE